jgi:hypothetical protein
VVANAFNLRYLGRSITPHTALQVSPDELRFGRTPGKTYAFGTEDDPFEMGLADREMVGRYLSLSQAERKTIRDVVSAFVLAKAAENLP